MGFQITLLAYERTSDGANNKLGELFRERPILYDWEDSEYTGLLISPSGISELDCATAKTDTAERSISIGRESLQVFFLY